MNLEEDMAKKKPLRVTEIIDFRTGLPHTSENFLSLEEGEQNNLRRELTRCYKHHEKYLVCGLCRGALCLRGGGDNKNRQRLHFFHLPSKESSSCPLHGGQYLSKEATRAIIYDGVRESPLHEEMKNKLGTLFGLDTNCHSIIIDKLFARREKCERFKPDVQGYFFTKNIIFEVQLSSDFISIILNREEYYQSKGAYLIWVFRDFPVAFSKQTLAQKDIFYGSNRNAFCFTKKCEELSSRHNKLHLEVVYQVPYIDGDDIGIRLEKPKIVTLDDIIFSDTFLAYFYDFAGNKADCLVKANEIKQNKKDEEAKKKRDGFLIEIGKKIEKDDNSGVNTLVKQACGVDYDFENAIGFLRYIISANKEKPTLIGGANNKSLYRNVLNRKNKQVRTFFVYFHAVARETSFYSSIPIDLKKLILDAFNDIKINTSNSDFYPDKQYEVILQSLFPKSWEFYKKLCAELGI